MGLIQRTVYFRSEDIPAWDAIGNKAEWLHIKLQEDQPSPAEKLQGKYAVGLPKQDKPITRVLNDHPNFLDKKKGTRK